MENYKCVDIKVDGRLMCVRYIELGDPNIDMGNPKNKAFVFAHGMGIPPHAYASYLEKIAEDCVYNYKYHVVAPDLHPVRDDKIKPRTLKGYANKLLDFCSALGIEKFYLGGHSTGGGVAYYAAAKSDRVKALVLFAPVLPVDYNFLGFSFRGIKGVWKGSIVDTEGMARFACLDKLVYPWWSLKAFCGGLKEAVDLVKDIHGFDFEQVQDEIRQPVVLFQSGDDVYYTIDDSVKREITTKIPHVQILDLSREAHGYLTFNPNEAAERTLGFLDGLSRSQKLF